VSDKTILLILQTLMYETTTTNNINYSLKSFIQQQHYHAITYSTWVHLKQQQLRTVMPQLS